MRNPVIQRDGPQRVAFSHDWLLVRRGAERVLSQLLTLFEAPTIYALFFRPESIPPQLREHQIRCSVLNGLPGLNCYYRYLLPFFRMGIESLRVEDADCLISIHHSVAKGIPHDSRIRHICYCLTPVRYLWEPELYGAAIGRSWKGRLLALFSNRLKTWDLKTNEGVDEFVAISKTVQERIRRVYARPSEVIYPGVDLDFYSPMLGSRENFYLIVSALVPQKRVDLAVKVFRRMKLPLVVVGEGPLRRRIEAGAGPSVTFLGWQDDRTVRELYRRARALIFPGEEDFGLVPVEAQACGCPVIGLGKGGLTETVTDSRSGLLFQEPECESLEAAISRFEGVRFHPVEVRKGVLKFSSRAFLENWKKYLAREREERKEALG